MQGEIKGALQNDWKVEIFLCSCSCIFSVVFMSTSSSSSGRILIYLTKQPAAQHFILIDMMCHLRMASVLSSCVLCSPCNLTCRFQRSPGALRGLPHIKASLISATLIVVHPMIINLRRVYMRESARTNTSIVRLSFLHFYI